MINIDFVYQVEAERRKDEIAQAERYCLIRQLPGRNSPIKKAYHRLLVRLGGLLVTWGSELQSRFGGKLTNLEQLHLNCPNSNETRACYYQR